MIKRVWIGNVEAITDKQTNRQNFNLKTRPHRVKRFKETVLLKAAAKCVMLRPPFIRFVFCVLCAVQCVMLCSPFSHKERGADKTSGAVTLLCSRWIRSLPLLTLLRCNYFHTRPKTFGSSVLYIPSSPFFKLSSSPCRKIFYSRLLYSLEFI